ncbi:MAG: hypothetical protein AB7S48_16610 [Bacteroidales bacterium]
MKITIQLIAILILTASILTSCVTPSPVIRITPKEAKTTWEQGKEFVSYKKNDFIVHCAYHGINASFLIFDVEVINNSQEDYLLSPENFIMYTDSGKWNSVTNQIVYATFPIKAVDPEQQLLLLDMQQSLTEANMKNQQTAAAIVSIAAVPVIVATAVADSKDDKPRTVSRTDLAATATVGVLGGLDAGQEDNAYALNTIDNNRNTWEQYALRKTTLSTGEAIRGLIYFPKPDLEKYQDLQIDAPILNNDKITFQYKVKLYYPGVNQLNEN